MRKTPRELARPVVTSGAMAAKGKRVPKQIREPKRERSRRAALFLNRELGLLEFNRRVFALAEDRRVPLLERLRFVCIVDDNLDEFFEIRVAGLKAQIAAGSNVPGPDGIAPEQVFRQIAHQTQALVDRMYRLLNDELFPALAAERVRFLRRSKWTEAQRAWVKAYFFKELMPLLTPLGLDPAHPFDLPGFFGPLISRKMAPYERGAHEKESIHGRTDGRSAA